ncbi:Domain in Tre-2, BUB2p, and Cdc16p putative Rab-GAPs [Teratosphaeria destructans]|uniref:Domain in Tre-2, BUB2p, and Cdc16p putative Rab-GAPs n=1 Tax=Teratosphaeria destructans TaxID=418781 RepID=A0A9W7VZE0_9PEZI|nr:Domain in Tre-2, BUB2p, and Cdc16p putative Rab-GAPs [Teratosphaeria destructans]
MSHEVAQRLQDSTRLSTPNKGSALLKSIRYEDAANGVPPIPAHPKKPPPPLPGQAYKRPATSPVARSVATALREAAKRDSGIAPSVATAGRSSSQSADSHVSVVTAAPGAAREPSLPSIVVQDEEPPEPNIERSSSPLRPLGSRKRRERPATAHAGSPAASIEPIKSFKGIQGEIPTGKLGDIDLEDLASDKLSFSQRGSLLFGGKKMNELIAAAGAKGSPSTAGAASTVASPGSASPGYAPSDAVLQSTAPTREPPPQGPGLVSGRRKPSVQMLQAALHDRRVLSAEEISLSMKVRSMYEHGDERAADWTTPVTNPSNGHTTPEPSRDAERPASSINALVVDAQAGNRSSSAASVHSNYAKQAHEVAGGIEDWENVNGQDVDRYGFISPKRASAQPDLGLQGSIGEQLQRVATPLRTEATAPRQERKLYRGLTSKRSSRSMPSMDEYFKKANGSMHSFKSHDVKPPSSRLFRTRDKRILAEAGDMLSLPPGLAGIPEQEASREAAEARRREWTREQKWQKMARSSRAPNSEWGKGMVFEFDVDDPTVISRTWKGIPDSWRSTAWHGFLTTSAKRRGKYIPDDELRQKYAELQRENCADDLQIDVDVPRTINMHVMFNKRYRGGQRLLFRVLHAICLYCPQTGYVQGMASLAATLLCYYDEENAFVMMVRLWQLRGLEQMFVDGFAGLLKALEEFRTEWLRGGDIARKLEDLGVPDDCYGVRWYLTLFNLSLPFPAQLRVWDVFMLLGDAPLGTVNDFGGADLDVLHATSAALLDATRDVLLASDFENAMKVLTSAMPIQDEDLLMRVAKTEYKMRKKRAGIKI